MLNQENTTEDYAQYRLVGQVKRPRYTSKQKKEMVQWIKSFWINSPNLTLTDMTAQINEHFKNASGGKITEPAVQNFCHRYKCGKLEVRRKHLKSKNKSPAKKNKVKNETWPVGNPWAAPVAEESKPESMVKQLLSWNIDQGDKIKILEILIG